MSLDGYGWLKTARTFVHKLVLCESITPFLLANWKRGTWRPGPPTALTLPLRCAVKISLALLRDEEGALSRCIIAADIEGISVAPYDGEVAQTQPCAPVQSHIAAYFIDHPDASEKVRAVLDAQTQDEADEAVAQLWDESMEWYAPEEREDVIRILRQMH